MLRRYPLPLDFGSPVAEPRTLGRSWHNLIVLVIVVATALVFDFLVAAGPTAFSVARAGNCASAGAGRPGAAAAAVLPLVLESAVVGDKCLQQWW